MRPGSRISTFDHFNVDCKYDSGAFKDISADFDAFGELVSRDLVDNTNRMTDTTSRTYSSCIDTCQLTEFAELIRR